MRAALVLAPLLLLLAPRTADAGACPTCTTSQECVTLTGDPNARCVEWFSDFGCGTQRITCCPGQGCNTFNGQPSCIADMACRVVDGNPPADAGNTDTGAPQNDGGVAPPDGGGPILDAGLIDTGTPPGDGGTAQDTGTSTNTGGPRTAGAPRDRPGCGCSTGSAGSDASIAWLMLFGLIAISRARASA